MVENRTAKLKITGMVCAACTSAIEKSLKSLDGVHNAQVNLATEIASVDYDSGKVKLHDLEKAVKDAGYDVINEKVALKIGKMTCAMCVGSLQIALKKIDGITDVNINLAAETAYVTYNSRMVLLEDMRKAIEDIGYQFLGVAGEESTADLEKEAREKDLKDKKRRIIVGFSVSFFLMGLMYMPLHLIIPMNLLMAIPMTYIMLVISLPPFVYVSYPIFNAASKALSHKSLNMDVMYAMGIGVAYSSSILGTFQIVLTPDFMFYETAVMLASFLTLGRYLETKAK
jgi:Cu+-exporting ATPase